MLVLGYPAAVILLGGRFPRTQFRTGAEDGLYRFLEQQPKDSLVATLSPQADFIPSLARRSILVGYEYGIPYHLGYYDQFQRRTRDLLEAQYTSDSRIVSRFVANYGVTHWLMEYRAFTKEYVARSLSIIQLPAGEARALAALDGPWPPFVQRMSIRCTAYRGVAAVLLDAVCLKTAADE